MHPSPSRHLRRDDTIRYTTHYYDAEREDAQDPFAYELELAVDKLSTPKKPLPEPSNKPLSPRSEKGASGPSNKPSPKQKTPRKSLDRMFEKAAKGKGCGAALLALPAPPKAEADMSLWGALGHLVIPADDDAEICGEELSMHLSIGCMYICMYLHACACPTQDGYVEEIPSAYTTPQKPREALILPQMCLQCATLQNACLQAAEKMMSTPPEKIAAEPSPGKTSSESARSPPGRLARSVCCSVSMRTAVDL